ncbi:unnamed protein product [Dicrocoelium dendriticum]|nr:unnamed protein product [Dicrocoelium dendriticum]
MYGLQWQLGPVMALQIAFYALSFVPNADLYLAVTPGRFFVPNYYLWTVLTFSFFNHSVFFLLSDLLTLFLLNNLLSFYTWSKLLKFCAVVNLCTALCTISTLLLLYSFTFNTDLLFNERICGLIALLGGLTVVGRQMMGEKLLVGFPLGNIRYKHIPFMSVVTVTILFTFELINFVSLSMFLIGVLVAWLYLRFFQRHESGTLGDVTDSFTFSGFFPNHLQPPVAILSSALFNFFVRLKLCKKPAAKPAVPSTSVISFVLDVDELHCQESRPSGPEKISMLVTPDAIGFATAEAFTVAPLSTHLPKS